MALVLVILAVFVADASSKRLDNAGARDEVRGILKAERMDLSLYENLSGMSEEAGRFGEKHCISHFARVLNDTSESEYLMLQLLYSLQDDDLAASNIIMEKLSSAKLKDPFAIHHCQRVCFRFRSEVVHKAVTNYVHWFSHIHHPPYVHQVMLLLAKEYSLASFVSSKLDLMTIAWLIKSNTSMSTIDPGVVQHLWEQGAKQYINTTYTKSEHSTAFNQSFLDFLVSQGNIETIAYLLDKNVTNLFDVIISCLNQNATKLKEIFLPELLKHTLNPKTVDTLLEDILKSSRFDILEEVVGTDTGVQETDYEGITLLYKAIGYNSKNMVEFLIRAGADVNYTSKCNTSLLHAAVIRNDTHVLQELINLGAYMYAEDCHGHTPMHLAIKLNNINMISKLVDNDFDVNFKFGNGNTIIYFAIANSTSNTLKALIKLGCKINVINDNGVTPLLEALLQRNSSAVNVLVKSGANYNYTTSGGNTLMHLCAMKGSTSCIHALRAMRLGIDKTNKQGKTPLYKAVELNKPDVIKELIQSGANYSVKAKNGDSLVHVAADSESVAALRALLKTDLKADTLGHGFATPMERAIRKDCTACMRTLRDYGADIHRPVSYAYNSSLLHDAARHGKDMAAQWLVENGLYVDTTDSDGWTALHWAVLKKHISTVRTLIRLKANLNALNADGVTPLYIAARKGHPEIMQVLLEHGADPDIRNKIGYAALHIAASSGHHSAVHELLNADLNVDIRTDSGNTALHLATWKGHLSIVQELLRYPCDVSLATNAGYTALHVAIIFDRLDIAIELMNHKADITAVTTTGYTPIKLAIYWRRKQILEVLLMRSTLTLE